MQALATQNRSGIKVTTTRRSLHRNSLGVETDFGSEPDIFYLQGEWRRFESHRSFYGRTKPDGSPFRVYGPRVVNILRPDLGQMFELNLDASEYSQMPYPPRRPQPLTKEQMEARGLKMPSPGGVVKPTFRIETITKDTGERREVFGYVARHVITTRKEIPFEGSGRLAQEMVTDGWYIDLEPELYPRLYPPPKRPTLPDGKPVPSGRIHSFLASGSGITDKAEFVDIGEPETGFAMQELRTTRMTTNSPDGTPRDHESTSETFVTLEKGVYDAALFEVPSGFKRVQYINRNPA